MVKKILSDTLKSPEGKFSRKNLTMFASFHICIIMGFIDMLTQYKINEVIFMSFMGMAAGQSALTVYDKKNNNSTEREVL